MSGFVAAQIQAFLRRQRQATAQRRRNSATADDAAMTSAEVAPLVVPVRVGSASGEATLARALRPAAGALRAKTVSISYRGKNLKLEWVGEPTATQLGEQLRDLLVGMMPAEQVREVLALCDRAGLADLAPRAIDGTHMNRRKRERRRST
jgi:hypothetical protein